MRKNSLYRIVVTLSLFFSLVVPAHGANDASFGVANVLPITDKVAKDGSIIGIGEDGSYIASKRDYDATVIGVVAENPAVVFEINDQKRFPVINTGTVNILVTTINGEIKKGDTLAASTIAGAAMKATKPGFVLGAALANYKASDSKAVGKIPISLNIHYNYTQSKASSKFLDIIQLSTIATYEQPVVVLKYGLGGIILIAAFVIAFASFARASQRGIEAIGRNPLAGHMIQFSIFLNVLISVAIIIAGFGLAYLLIKL